MSRSSSIPVNENQDLVGDNVEKLLGFGGERDFDLPVNEDTASKESYDSVDKDDNDVDSVSDRESFTCGMPIVELSKIQPEIGIDGLVPSNESDKTHGWNFVFESSIAEPINLQSKTGVGGFVLLDKSDRLHGIIKNRFILGLGALGVNAEVEHIDRDLFCANAITQAKLQSFLVYAKAVKNKTGGHANIRYAWFGAAKDEINDIIVHGFSHDNVKKDGAFGYGLYLCTDQSPIESVKSSTVDEEGLKHILLCRVLLGKMEAVKPGSTQCHPSSEDFQTGVDNLEFPRKYIVWSTQLNTHVLPEFVITFKTLSGSNGPPIERVQFEAPLSPWMSIKALISGLSKILPPEAMEKIDEYHRNYIERKISRHDMLQGVRDLAGDRLLLTVLKDFREQQQLKRVRTMEAKTN